MTQSQNRNPKPTLADLVGAPVDLPVGTITLTVQPLGWYESIEVIDSIMPALVTMPSVPMSQEQAAAQLEGAQLGAWLAWLGANRDAVVRFCHLASKEDDGLIEKLSPVHLLELVFGLVEVNADFFGQSLPGLMARVGTRAQGLVGRLKTAASQAGFTTTSSD